jgi:hypothetical protein
MQEDILELVEEKTNVAPKAIPGMLSDHMSFLTVSSTSMLGGKRASRLLASYCWRLADASGGSSNRARFATDDGRA